MRAMWNSARLRLRTFLQAFAFRSHLTQHFETRLLLCKRALHANDFFLGLRETGAMLLRLLF